MKTAYQEIVNVTGIGARKNPISMEDILRKAEGKTWCRP